MASVKDIRGFLDSDIAAELDRAFEGQLPADMNKDSIEDKRKAMLEDHPGPAQKGYEDFLAGKKLAENPFKGNEAIEWINGWNESQKDNGVREGADGKVGGSSVPCTAGASASTVGSQDVGRASELDALGAKAVQSAAPSEGRLPKDLTNDKLEDKMKVMLETPGAGVIEPKSQYAVTPPQTHSVASTGSAFGSGTAQEDLKVGDPVQVEMQGGGGSGIVRGFGQQSKDHVLVELSDGLGRHWMFRKFLKKVGESAQDITNAMKKSLKVKKDNKLQAQLVGKGVMVGTRERYETQVDLFSAAQVVSEAATSDFQTEGQTYEADADDLDLLIQNDEKLYRWLHDGWYKNFSRKMKKGVFDPAMAVQGMMYVAKEAAKQWFRETSQWMDDPQSKVVKPGPEVIRAAAEVLVKEFQEWYASEGPGNEATAGSAGSSAKPTVESITEVKQEEARDIKEALSALNADLDKALHQAKDTAGKLAVMEADPSLMEAFRRIVHEEVIATLEDIQDKVVPKLNEMSGHLLGGEEAPVAEARSSKSASSSSASGAASTGVKKAGFDLTSISPENWVAMLKQLGAAEKPENVDTGKGYPTWQWKGDGILVVTAQDPVTGLPAGKSMGSGGTEVGYASYIGLEGSLEKVKAAADFIQKHGQYKDYSPDNRDFI
jgi:ribosome modulation factor